MRIDRSYLGNQNTYAENNPKCIVVHNTDNFAAGADARAHARAQHDGNFQNISAHYYVDDGDTAYQAAPHSRGCWHVGINYGGKNLFQQYGNKNSIGVEMCVQAGYNYEKAFENTAALVREIMRETGIPLERVYRHYDICSKYCPSQIMNRGDWDRMKRMIGSGAGSTGTGTAGSGTGKTYAPGIYQVQTAALNIRQAPDADSRIAGTIRDQGSYTVTEIQNTSWGRLLSGAGWVNCHTAYCRYAGPAKEKSAETAKSSGKTVAEDGKKKKKRKKKLPSDFYDYNLLACTILLVSFGLIMLYSASAYEAASTFKGNDMYYFTHQAGLSAIVLVGIVILSKFVDYHSVWFQRIAALVYWGSLLLMAAVRFTPLGYEAYGARRWLRIGGVSLQPAEIGKLGLILYLPYIILKMGKNMRTIRAKAIVLGLGVLQALAAWILTDNLSTAIILGLIACVILFLADPEVKFYARVIPGAAVIGVFAIIILKNNLQIFERIGGDFRSNRIYEWLSGGSYQILQGLYAIGSGGFLGKGLGNSTQKITTIPEAQNDMIFSIICEELGIFGALLVLLLFGYLLYRLFVVAQNAPDAYGMLMVSGVFAHISIQVILNLCVVLKLMPATGITLPFISYGGTSVLFILTEIGIALCVSRFIVFQDGKSGEGEAQAEEQ